MLTFSSKGSDSQSDRHPIWSHLLVACTLANAMAFVTANIVAVKLVSVGGFVIPGGAIVYPLSFLIGDVVTEVYGYRAARRMIWFGFLANAFFVAAAEIVRLLPAAPFWTGQQAYNTIIGYTPRIFAAASCSYLVGDFANAVVMSRFKVLTKGRFLWVRTIFSTFIGQGLDSAIFVTIAFAGQATVSQIGKVILTVWLFKTLYEAAVTPVTYAVVGWMKRIEKTDVYDLGVGYNPFSMR